MKKQLVRFITCTGIMSCISFSSTAQNLSTTATVKEGPVMSEGRASISGLIGYDGSTFYVQKTVKGDLAISRVDGGLSESEMAAFDKLKHNDLRRNPTNFVMANGKLYMLSNANDKKAKKYSYFVEQLDNKSLQPKGAYKTLSEIEYEKRRATGTFDYVVSRDESKVLVFSNDPDKKGEEEEFDIKIFNDDMQLLWNKHDKIPYAAGLFFTEQYYVDVKGNAYIIGVEYTERRVSKRDGKANYKYHILAYINNGKDFKDYEVSLDEKFITDLRFEILPNGEMVACGFYSKVGTYTMDGTFYLSIDAATRQVKHQSIKEFSFEFMTETMSDRKKDRAAKKEAKGKDMELANFVIRDMILKENGGAVIIAEQYWMHVVCTRDPKTGAQSCTYHYYYMDMITISISPSGDIEWNTRTRKLQHTTNDGGYYSSYASAVVDDKIYIIFNDNPKNMIEGVDLNKKVERYGKGREIAVTIVQIDASGKQKRELLFSVSKGGDVRVRPKISRQYGTDKLLLLGERGKKYQYFDVTFKH